MPLYKENDKSYWLTLLDYKPIRINPDHLTPSNPLATTANPIMAPTILCVPETGRAQIVAKMFHTLAPNDSLKYFVSNLCMTVDFS